ncbi:MAG: GIY-YIG nuclease family protein [Aestuariivirga sp.]|uniref:GIY-YIG nuclease family protein n=1 Tax=Aestuariivirga sp. TaxID=2650926 RepID=UPI0025BE9DA9|nr:GIY-YIG nuclease family protein [Aestuariivirga sp.]MCA3559943.1 GIY-YIG nuclease family protein [Aestuariivirga sp.]
MKPRSINIFLLDGDPSGIRVAQISMSTIQAIAFRRNQLRRVRETFPEIERPGVYILIGSDENHQDRQLAYIGESEGVGARLSYHNSNESGRDAKGFWTDTVVLISKDENLTKSHARYVESSLIRNIGGSIRWSMPNSKRPSDDAGKLPLQDRVDMDEFVDQTKTLVGALGWDLFREMKGRPPEIPGQTANVSEPATDRPAMFTFIGEGYAAKMMVGSSGEFVVTEGSKARARTTRTVPRGTLALRETLLERGVLRRDGDFLVFTSSYSFSSPSSAASAVIGASANGRILWKLPDGHTYSEWEAGQEGPQQTAT